MRSAVFLDVDGTYLIGGEVPPSAADAVRAARDRGHAVFLCTGRSLAEIGGSLTEAGFDGIISAGGALAEYAGHVVVSHAFPRPLLRRTLAWLDARGIHHILETDAALLGSDGVRMRLARIAHPELDAEALAALVATGADIVKPVVPRAGRVPDDVRKILFLGSDVPLAEVRAAFGAELDVIGDTIPSFGAGMGELTLPGVHKAAAIARVVAAAGIDRADTIAFGDGPNDLEMLAWVGVGVAMADASPEVRAAADLVVPAASDDGIAVGFRRLGLC